MATQAEVRELIAHIRRTGYKVTKHGTKHYKVLSPKGAAVVDANGPLIISATPSEVRWRDMTVKRLMAVGVLKDDPYAETRGKKGTTSENGDGEKETADDRKRAAREAVAAAAKARSDENARRSLDLRYRLERMIVKLGGWNTAHGTAVNGVSIADFMRIIQHWLAKPETKLAWPTDKGLPTSLAAASQALANLRKADSTIGAKWLPVFEGFMDYLYAEDAADSELAATRYRILVRETRGAVSTGVTQRTRPALPAEPGAGRATIEPPSENGEVVDDIGPGFQPAYIDAPELALKALYYMARGSDDARVGEPGTIVDIARSIAELEQNNPNRGKVRRT